MQYATILRAKAVLTVGIVGMLMLSGSPVSEMDARLHPFSPISIDEADSLMARLDDQERIAQLFVSRSVDSVDVFCAGYLYSSASNLMHRSETDPNGIPYFIGLDLIESKDFSISEEQLSATNDLNLVGKYARAIGVNLKAKGFNFIVGPSLDLHTNDFNPYTLKHSFSDDPEVVARFANAYVNGLRSAGLFSVVGSFPGIGNMEHVSDQETPLIASKKSQLFGHDLIPFKTLINAGIQNIMVANAYAPALDSSFQALASSSIRVHNALRGDLGFNGLAWSDLTYVQTGKKTQEMVVNHLKAGTDVLIVEGDVRENIRYIEEAIEKGLITQTLIDAKCKRVIQSKLWYELNASKSKPAKRPELDQVLREREVIQNSLTLLRNDDNLIPLKRLDTLSMAIVRIGDQPDPNLVEHHYRYSDIPVFELGFENLESDFSKFQKLQSQYNLVIIIANPELETERKGFGIGAHYQSVIERLAYPQQSIFVWNGNPKALLYVSNIPSIRAIISGYRETDLSSDFTIQAIFGGRPFTGRLKRKIGDEFEREFGISTTKSRLSYGIPEEVGILSEYLVDIDKTVYLAISSKATPGAQVWFAKDGMVVVDEAYGYHRYDDEPMDTVLKSDLYDLASITKIAGSVAGLMKLSQDSLFDLNDNLCDYLSEWVDTTEYMNMGLRDMLAHQAGLPSFIPFYQATLNKGIPRYDIYSIAQNDIYPYRVARELYINKAQPDKMFRQILAHKIKPDKKYLYSDVGYYFMLRIIEKQSGMKMEDYLDQVYYRPLGLSTMTYRPLLKFDKSRITPTEYDRYFRKQLIQGDVHDPGAAMLGGVGGHAGLFSNANDLGILMQMYLNGGIYGGERYFDSTIIADFVRCQFCENDNRRGAGFDKPLTSGKAGPSCGCTDLEAFGHQGFTGTVTWADPRDQVVYVFLSNRVYPDAENRKLAEMNIRTDIQQIFHDAVKKSKNQLEAGTQL